MKIYLSHATSFDYLNKLYAPLKQSQLFLLHQLILPHDNSHLPTNSKELISSCDMLIAEVSFPSTGQGIELGWANNLNIPIYCICQENAKYSTSLKLISKDIYSYQNENDLPNIIATIIAS